MTYKLFMNANVNPLACHGLSYRLGMIVSKRSGSTICVPGCKIYDFERGWVQEMVDSVCEKIIVLLPAGPPPRMLTLRDNKTTQTHPLETGTTQDEDPLWSQVLHELSMRLTAHGFIASPKGTELRRSLGKSDLLLAREAQNVLEAFETSRSAVSAAVGDMVVQIESAIGGTKLSTSLV